MNWPSLPNGPISPSVCWRSSMHPSGFPDRPEQRQMTAGTHPYERRMTRGGTAGPATDRTGALLTEVEARLARAPAAPAGLEDLKNSVDSRCGPACGDFRRRLWRRIAPMRVERPQAAAGNREPRGVQASLGKPGPRILST